jgi:molybdopterin molybdotransferase
MKFFRIVSAAALRETIRETFGAFRLSAETVPLRSAASRVLASDMISPEDAPAFDRSQVDGYALPSASTTGATESIPSVFRLAGRVKMGEAATVTADTVSCIYVPTGAMMPGGADCAAKIEDCEELPDGMIAVFRPHSPGENVLRRGDDCREGMLVLAKGSVLFPRRIAPLAALGFMEIPVVRKPRYAVVSTGDEIVPEGIPPAPGQIRDSNAPSLAAMTEAMGGEISGFSRSNDDENSLLQVLREAVESSDCVLVSGGSSVGERDHVRRVIGELPGSRILAHGVGLKPGKPAIVASLPGGKAVFGLPGHPASSAAVFLALVGAYHESVTGQTEAPARTVRARLDGSLRSSAGMETWQPCTLSEQNSELIATPLFGRSGSVTLFSRADGFLVLPPEVEGLENGADVSVRLL